MTEFIEHDGVKFRAICKRSDVLQRSGISAELNEYTDIALFDVDGEVIAVNNECPHQHAPVIASGIVHNGTVTCPMHGWCFDLRTGMLTGEGNGKLKRFSTIIENGIVYVEDADTRPAWMRD